MGGRKIIQSFTTRITLYWHYVSKKKNVVASIWKKKIVHNLTLIGLVNYVICVDGIHSAKYTTEFTKEERCILENNYKNTP